MKKFMVNLLSNRFGIVLAALNVCFFVSGKAVGRVFEHLHGESCVFSKIHILASLGNGNVPDVILLQNLPAALFSILPSLYLVKLFPDFCIYTQIKFQFFLLLFFVVLQWLFIGWTAKTLAEKLRRYYLK